jgi:hypothetical protein
VPTCPRAHVPRHSCSSRWCGCIWTAGQIGEIFEIDGFSFRTDYPASLEIPHIDGGQAARHVPFRLGYQPRGRPFYCGLPLSSLLVRVSDEVQS